MLIDETRTQTLYQAVITVHLWAKTPQLALAVVESIAAHLTEDDALPLNDVWIGNGVVGSKENITTIQHDTDDD